VHSYGGIVLHDVINDFLCQEGNRERSRRTDRSGWPAAGGHAGTTSPFALIQEISGVVRRDLCSLFGCHCHGKTRVLGQPRPMGGRPRVCGLGFDSHTGKARADERYKQMDRRRQCRRYRVLQTCLRAFTATNLRAHPSSVAASNPDALEQGNAGQMNFGASDPIGKKAWKDIWGCGQGIGGREARSRRLETLVARNQT